MTSLWEGLPLSLIEALALGKPVVATDVGGNAEVVEDNINGYIVSPKDVAGIAAALLELYKNKAKLGHYKEKNVARFNSTFSLKEMLKEHLHLYRKLH
jgi:glycosyltransferase involved in cell wall biosynthesis